MTFYLMLLVREWSICQAYNGQLTTESEKENNLPCTIRVLQPYEEDSIRMYACLCVCMYLCTSIVLYFFYEGYSLII